MSIEPPSDSTPLGGDEEIEAILRESFETLDNANLQELDTKIQNLAKILNKNPEHSRERLESYAIEHQEVGEAQVNKLLSVLYEQADLYLRKALFSKYDQAIELCRSLNLNISEKEICLNEEARIQVAKASVQNNLEEIILNIHKFGITKQKALIEIAKLCAQQDGGTTAQNIYSFGITDQNALIEIAKLCAQQNVQVTIWNLVNFNIKDPNGLIELAKVCAQQDGWATARNIQSFGITDQNVLIEIAKLCAQQNGGGTTQNIRNFNITDQNTLVEIAKLCAQQNVEITIQNIHQFNITDQNALIEIAKFCAQQNGEITAQNFRNFNITDPHSLIEIGKLCAEQDGGIILQNSLIEIAKFCAQQDGEAIAQNIHHFRIIDPDALVEIAKFCVQQNLKATAENVHNFRITPDDLIEIAKFCAQQDGRATAENIHKFSIRDPDALIEIAKLCAQQNLKATAENLHRFSLPPEAVIEIAQFCAQEYGEATAQNIHLFNITVPEALIEIAKLCTRQNLRATIENLHNFRMTPEAVIEIAKFCARQDGEVTAQNIHLFRITDPDALIEIAKLCVQQNLRVTTENLRNFRMTPEAVIEIVKFCAQQNLRATIQNIHNFRIAPDTLIEIAKFFARQDGIVTGQNIHNFRITDPIALIEISKLCAEQICSVQERANIARRIESLGITDQNTLIEIAKLCAQHNGEVTARHLRNFGIHDITQVLSIFSLCALENPRALRWLPQPLAPLPYIFKMDASDVWNQALAETTLKEFIDWFHPNCGMEWIFDYLAKIPDKYAKRTVTIFFATALFILGERLSEDRLRFLNGHNLIQAVFTLKAPSVYLPLISALTEIAGEDGIETLFEETPDLKKLERYRSFNKLIRLFLVGLQAQGISKDFISQFVSHFETGALYKSLRDSSKARSLITALAYLVTCKELAAEEKRRVLDILASSNPQKFIDTLSLIKMIFNMHEAYLLKELNEDENELTRIVLSAARQHIEIQPIGNFEEQYAKTFDARRRPDAFWQYVAKMEQLHDPTIRQSLSLLFNSILTETFYEVRYDLERNPHLKALSERNPNLLAQWRPSSAAPISSQESNGIRIILTDDPFDLLLSGTEIQGSCQDINGDPKLNKGLLGYIMNGQNLLIAAVDQSGKIQARALLRLLWNGERPVLLLEPRYGNLAYYPAIVKGALEKAKIMGLTLTSPPAPDLENPFYPLALSSLGGIAPYDYSDSGDKVVKSQFSIHANALLTLRREG